MKKITLVLCLFLFTAVSAMASGVPESFSEVVKKTSNGVVNISTSKMVTRQVMPFINDDFFRHFFGDTFPEFGGGSPKQYKTKALGSGFVIDKNGYIVTNNHVIEGADEIIIKFKNDKEFQAEIVGADPLTDLALLKIDPKGADLTPITLGDINDSEIGDWVVAIGNPLGLGGTVTAGIISAKGRVLESGPYDNFVQTDASINPGNSGGPLLNMRGEVIGVNTAIIQSAQGLGFAVPVNMLKDILPMLKQGKVTRGWLGVTLQTLDENLAKSFGMPNTEGVLVANVIEGDPAALGGVMEGDIILAVDGVKVADSRALTSVIGSKSPGETVVLTVFRDGKKMNIKVTLGERPSGPDSAEGSRGEQNRPITVTQISPEDASKLGIKTGVVVSSINEDTSAFEAGLRKGDVIVWFNKNNVTTPKQFYDMLNRTKKGEVIGLKIVNRNGSRFVAFNKD
ncbi:MAG: Do family serine endopeptidase [Deferribacterales bacterium]|nr:Do family serine endopeptidase [Deferribacterales bacterium]